MHIANPGDMQGPSHNLVPEGTIFLTYDNKKIHNLLRAACLKTCIPS